MSVGFLSFSKTIDEGLLRALEREFAPVAPLFRPPALMELADSLTEPGRLHHNLHYILTLLRLARPLFQFAEEPVGLRIALLFHDAIYHIPLTANMPRPRDNEERSVRFMAMLAKDPTHPAILHAAELIRGTVNYDAARGRDGPLMHDLVLSVLAVRRSRYAEFERRLRAEYNVYPQPLYCAQRATALRRILERSRIYAMPYLAARWESPARGNLAWATAHLAQGLIPGELALV